jgi:hypothetical protein
MRGNRVAPARGRLTSVRHYHGLSGPSVACRLATASARDSARDDGPDSPVIEDHLRGRNRALAGEECGQWSGGNHQRWVLDAWSAGPQQRGTTASRHAPTLLETAIRKLCKREQRICPTGGGSVRLGERRDSRCTGNCLTAGTRLRKMGGHGFSLSSEPRASDGTLRA